MLAADVAAAVSGVAAVLRLWLTAVDGLVACKQRAVPCNFRQVSRLAWQRSVLQHACKPHRLLTKQLCVQQATIETALNGMTAAAHLAYHHRLDQACSPAPCFATGLLALLFWPEHGTSLWA